MKKTIFLIISLTVITVVLLYLALPSNFLNPKTKESSIFPAPTKVPAQIRLPNLPSPTKTPPSEIPSGMKVYYFDNGQNEIFYDPNYVTENQASEEAKQIKNQNANEYSD